MALCRQSLRSELVSVGHVSPQLPNVPHSARIGTGKETEEGWAQQAGTYCILWQKRPDLRLGPFMCGWLSGPTNSREEGSTAWRLEKGREIEMLSLSGLRILAIHVTDQHGLQKSKQSRMGERES
jgi:hypothetical protein